jgi:hypothetical protein
MRANTSGGSNTSLGYSSLYSNTTGGYNTALGYDSMRTNTTSNYNTDVGYYSLRSNTTGNSNTALGYNSLYANTTGNSNTALGYYSLYANTTGSNNTALGYYACRYVRADGANKTCIGNNSGPASSSTDAISTANQMWLGTNATTVYIQGDLVVSGSLTNSYGAPYQLSDIRLKNVKGENKSGLEKIKQLKVFNYTFKDDKKKTPRVGVIAQDLQKIFPDAVTKDEKGYLLIRMEDMFYALVNAVKELDAKVNEILRSAQNDSKAKDAKIKALETKNKELEARITKLEAKLK